MSTRSLAIALALTLIATPAGAQNLLTDGGFEIGTVGPGGYLQFQPGDNFGAWTVIGAANGTGDLGVPRTEFDALEGVESAHIGNSVLDGGVEQSFATSIGGEYQVSFWGISWPGFGTGNGTVRVYNGAGDDLNELWSAPDPDGGGWAESSFTFIASDTSSTLEILNCCGFAMTIDAASVVQLAPLLVVHTEGQTLVWEEAQTTDSFTVVLTESPSAPVTVTLDPNSDDIGLNGAVPNDPVTLTFGTDDWDVPQTVTVMANDDDLEEGLEVVPIAIVGASDDNGFDFATGTSATVVDNDAAGFTVVESDGATEVVEGGATDSYTIVLTFAPAASANIALSLDDANQADLNPENLTFTTANWDTPQAVVITASDDDDIEAHPHPVTISHEVSSDDLGYDGFAAGDIEVAIGENDCDFGGAAEVGQVFDETDFDQNCLTDLLDFAVFASKFLNCAIGLCP